MATRSAGRQSWSNTWTHRSGWKRSTSRAVISRYPCAAFTGCPPRSWTVDGTEKNARYIRLEVSSRRCSRLATPRDARPGPGLPAGPVAGLGQSLAERGEGAIDHRVRRGERDPEVPRRLQQPSGHDEHAVAGQELGELLVVLERGADQEVERGLRHMDVVPRLPERGHHAVPALLEMADVDREQLQVAQRVL